MPIDDAGFKLAMSQFASGVTVVTTEHDGERYGLTVASFASLSLHPPLVMVCVEKNVRSHDVIAASGKFGISILAADQAPISNRFASRADDKFEGVATKTGVTGVPLLDGAVCTIECRLREALPGGDHSIFVGEVLEVTTTDAPPLVYFRSSYRELAS